MQTVDKERLWRYAYGAIQMKYIYIFVEWNTGLKTIIDRKIVFWNQCFNIFAKISNNVIATDFK